MKFYKMALLVFAGLLLVASLSFAQSALGSITVAVTDPQGASIPGATVTLSGVDTHVKRSETTGAEGSFVFAAVAPGSYIVTVLARGFRELRSTLTQTAAQSQRFDA